jgi:2-polyprenyl-3-methyl-5-hydroxy-6-metoxy-1,4-benzoquinol methylase
MNKAQKFWDKQAERFDNSQKQFDTASKEILARTREYLNANDHILDFGCASGSKTLEMAGWVKHVNGLDISSGMIGQAIKNLNRSGITNVTFTQGTIFNDIPGQDSFDKIIAFSIIHLLEESEKTIQRIHELLKPGGLFISETACFRENMDIKTRMEFSSIRFMAKLGLFPLHLNMFKSSDVEQLISRHNFRILKTERLFFHGMTISFIVAEKA